MAKKVYKEQMSPAKKKSLMKRSIPIYIMALPGLIYLFINNYMPMPGIVLAFKNYKAKDGIYGSAWAGFKNFKYLFSTQDAFVITRNTICYNLVFIVVNLIFAVGVAIILSELTSKAKKLYQSVILLPYLLSAVIVSYLVFAFLSPENGFVNNTILRGRDPISWYQEKKYWPFILVFVNLWKGIGYNCIIYLSTIIGFDRGLYEAAAIDGATKWQQIRMITLPLIKGTIITMVILNLGRIVTSDFSLFYQIPKNNGALYSVTQTLDVYVYNALMKNSDFAMSSAASVFQSIVGFIFVLITNAIVRKYNEESALF